MMQLIFAVFFLVLALKIVGLLLKICGKAVGIILSLIGFVLSLAFGMAMFGLSDVISCEKLRGDANNP